MNSINFQSFRSWSIQLQHVLPLPLPLLLLLLVLPHQTQSSSLYTQRATANTRSQITNEDTVLDIQITPPIRLNIFDTPQNLSDSGKQAVLTAMNQHATDRLQIYFGNNGSYYFDRVEFEIVESGSISRSGKRKERKMRVFEKEEADVRDFYGESEQGEVEAEYSGKDMIRLLKEMDMDMDLNMDMNMESSTTSEKNKDREMQQTQTFYGTTFLLTGKVKFSIFPSAPAALCNSQLYAEMQRDWWMEKRIKEQQNSELVNVKQWLIDSTRVTPAPTKAPTKSPLTQPSKEPTEKPSLKPSESPSRYPISSPSDEPSSTPFSSPSVAPFASPSDEPSLSPSASPTQKPSHRPSTRPSISPRPTQLYKPSTIPSSQPSKVPTRAGVVPAGVAGEFGDKDLDDVMTRSFLPIIIGSSLVSLAVFIGLGMFIKKVRKGRESSPRSPLGKKDLGHKRLNDIDEDSDDDDAFDNDDVFATRSIPSLMPTNEESGSTDSEEAGDYFSEPSGIASSRTQPSISSCQTMKMNNVSEKVQGEALEKKWLSKSPLKNTALVKGSMKPPMAPSSAQREFPIKLESTETHNDIESGKAINGNASEDSTSPNNISLTVVGAASAAVASGTNVGPSLMKYFVKRGDGENNRSRASSIASSPGNRSSPITSVTPSKVSKEEFEQGWDVDLPAGWSPRRNNDIQYQHQHDAKEMDLENAFNAFNDVDGSFPTFDANENLMDSNNMKAMSVASSRSKQPSYGMRSVGESTAYQSANEMHPMDWSNKGSEYDSTSIGESTFTDGENTATREMNRVSWDQVNSGGRTPLGVNRSELNTTNYHTPMTNGQRTPKSMASDPSRHSTYTSGSNCESSPSSRGSSKQLINDLVWLEKKIADVRKRVDKLDGDDDYSTISPPMSPDTTEFNTISGSPISHNIVCRDITAPPGKLNIVIHSTKDGPAIHSVKPGSALEGKLFKGDLVVAVDDTDTRTFNAVDVMEMMSQKSESNRKITVIHFANFEDMV